uniref:histidine kinase n=1 Tax=Candidatus Kentrum eta TaxID=2126337 RepID=A0A450UDC8_9GAMM|nr:MAG: Response regulator receiver domain-containing protein [Candidatus Kentron sp. H]VFJ91575.1 MAG: Response regulator receiver domain-containing protein [Candidatus Kentron sp. H]VFJ98161.1 MAG: Response regulator receiver domain-containing protein [Candidatus Kentron sp. H]
MSAADQPPSSNPDPQTDLAGRILPARIKKVRLDSCDLELLDGGTGSVIAQGRLYQAESLAWQDHRLLKDIPDYPPNKILEAVYIRRLRYEEGRALWYVHERWGKSDPWTGLELREEDIVTGTVARSLVSGKSGEHAGYLVQLDVEAPIRISESGIIEPSDRVQPDIEVFLPDGELPWADGSLGRVPVNDKIERLSLAIGDPIQAIVREIRIPPMNPNVSLIRLINHQDAIAEKTFKHRGNLARWRFWRLLGNTKTEDTPKESAPEFTPGDRPYTGKRFLLVDDNPDTLIAQSELLSLMGADVHIVEGRPRGFHDVMTKLEGDDFDIALIDNNLPGKNLGQRLINQVYARLENKYPARFVLITADNMQIPEGDTRAALEARGVKGFLQRPLKHDALQRLLAGEAVWEEANPHIRADQPTRYLPETTASPTIREMLETIVQQTDIHFALLIRASRQIEAQDLFAAGNAPFRWDGFREVLARTDLRLLIDERIGKLNILTQEGGNEHLCFGRDGRSHWQALELGATRWIFGVGYTSDKDIQVQLPLWYAALSATVDAQGWRAWGRHVSSFVQLGLAHQGLSHEVIHLQSEFHDLLFTLRKRFEKLQSGAVLKEEERKYFSDNIAALTTSNENLLAFSKHQLYEQALRHREVFLPDAVAAIKRIATYEFYEAEVGLHIVDPPPLALPLPNAALVLPVINLLLNAAKHHYRQENRRVELLFDLLEQDSEPFLVIDVRDNGPGLTQTALERLWQPGFSSAAHLEERHGIGLWLSRQLVAEAGGTLTLHEHWRGIGACFRLRFPIHLG